MNMLIIGNGFDLAHGRPTTYADFLKFLDYILQAKDFGTDRTRLLAHLNKEFECRSVTDYILSSFDTRKNPRSDSVGNTNTAIQEIYNCLDKNVWYEYFKAIRREDLINGKNWIDFEQEILNVIDCFDHQIGNIYDPVSDPQNDNGNHIGKIKHFWTLFCKKMQQEGIQKCLWSDFIDETYQDLQDLVRCLEIYLDDCVGKIPIKLCSPDIQGLEIGSVLSFNYTAIPTDIYPSLTNTHCIHGHAEAGRLAEENDMVIGVNEYWEGPEKNVRTNFNLYKKFVQRIIKGTGIKYKSTLNQMSSDYEEGKRFQTKTSGYISARYHNIYIFGHSLDVTDGDILREVMRTKGVITTIFYRDKQQQANQIANLSKVLGQDELLERTFSTSPTIIFKRQADMKKL